ncbi:MAG: acyl-CoA dehydrogenase [Balneolaceae bacterium]|nr:MAG: acyl-CoA dehydrogenase [Balneolaceae bacterium]
MSYNDWIGKSKDQYDNMGPEPLQRFEALLDHDPAEVKNGTVLPPCAHWIYFNPHDKQAELDDDGNPKRGGLLPPVDLPVRMWAGGKILFKKPLKAGLACDRKSTVVKIDEKEGTTGKLCFVTLRHQVSTAGAVAIDEEQQLVFREKTEEGAHPARTEPMDIDFDWKKTRKFTPVHLFRYSALTFNSHRIHYDYLYTTEEHGYPNLLVPAPLVLTLMMDAYKTKTDGKLIEEIEYRATGPLYVHEEMTITSKDTDNTKVELRALGPDNKIAMKASVRWIYSWNK